MTGRKKSYTCNIHNKLTLDVNWHVTYPNLDGAREPVYFYRSPIITASRPNPSIPDSCIPPEGVNCIPPGVRVTCGCSSLTHRAFQ